MWLTYTPQGFKLHQYNTIKPLKIQMGLCCTLQNPLSDSIHIFLPTNDKGRLVVAFNTCEIHLYLNFLHNCILTWFHRYHTIDILFFQTEITKQIEFSYIIINVIILIFRIIVI